MRRGLLTFALALFLGCFLMSSTFAGNLGETWSMGGEFQLEYVDTEGDDVVGEDDAHLQVNGFDIYPKAEVAENVVAQAGISFGQWGAELWQAKVTFSDLPANSEFMIGLDNRFSHISRGTNKHTFTTNGFSRSEEMKLQWKSTFDPMYAVISLSQGLRLRGRGINEDSSYAILGDRSLTSGYKGLKEVGLGLGYDGEFGEQELGALLFGYVAELSDEDIAVLQANLSTYVSNDDDQNRIGLNLTYGWNSLGAVLQYITAKDGLLDRTAWFIQPSYTFDIADKAQTIRIRYGELDVDNTNALALPMTWDREEVTIGLKSSIVDNVSLKTEYTINDEATGAAEVDNNEFCMQLGVNF